MADYQDSEIIEEKEEEREDSYYEEETLNETESQEKDSNEIILKEDLIEKIKSIDPTLDKSNEEGRNQKIYSNDSQSKKELNKTIEVVVHSSATFDTRFLNYKEIDELIEKLKYIGCTNTKKSDVNLVVVIPKVSSFPMGVDGLKDKIFDAYFDIVVSSEAMPPSETNPKKFVKDSVSFDDVLEVRVNTLKFQSSGSQHHGIIGMSDVCNVRNQDGTFRFPISASSVHYHGYLGSSKQNSQVSKPRIGLSKATKEIFYPTTSFLMYIVNEASVVIYQDRSVIEKEPGVFVIYYFVQRCDIKRDEITGDIKISTRKETVESTDLLKLIYNNSAHFRPSSKLVDDMKKITYDDLNMSIDYVVQKQQHFKNRNFSSR